MDSNLPLLVLIIFILTFTGVANATTFYIKNNCPHTVWAAAVPGGGTRLQSGETWILDVDDTTTTSRIWGRTGCQFDADGKGKCRTGDCNGLLKCQDYGNGSSTLAEYSLDQYGNMDFFDISLVDGYNVGMEFSAAPGGKCTALIRCEGNIVGECPYGLVVPGGCNGPCPTFNTEEYCCTSGGPCGPTTYSRFFKERCPAAYSYPLDDASNTFTCPAGTDYRVTFCP